MGNDSKLNNAKLAEHYSRDLSNKDVSTLAIGETARGELVKYTNGDTFEVDYLSPTQVVVNMGGKIYMINSEGVSEVVGGSETGRGVSIFTQYATEKGITYETQEQFHKGCILTKTDSIAIDSDYAMDNTKKPTRKEVPSDVIKDEIIWRD